MANDKPYHKHTKPQRVPFLVLIENTQNTTAFEVWPLIPYHSQSLDFKT